MLGRLSLRDRLLSLAALLALLLWLTVRAVPATAFYERFLPWIVARGVGIAALTLLAVLVSVGILLSHPVNRTVWRQSRELLIWHRYLSVFVFCLIAVHVSAILLDRFARVDIVGALVPGLSGYRAIPVALGTLALYAAILTAATAAYAQKLPAKLWLQIHRLGLLVFAAAWLHGILAGSDSPALRTLYVGSAVLVALSAATRYWLDLPRPRPVARTPAQREDTTA